MDLKSLRQKLIKDYTNNSISSAEASAELDILIETILNINKKDLIVCPEQEISDTKLAKLFKLVEKRLKERIPIQYLLGFTHFYGIKLYVEKGVLIPRSDTEILVETAIQYIQKNDYKLIADVGIGSGNISIALLKNCPKINAIATEISQLAIEIALKNVDLYNLNKRITIHHCRFLNAINVKVDAVISNPPYIPDNNKEKLEPEVKNHEPSNALFTNENTPLENYIKLSKEAYNMVNTGGMLAVEIESIFAEKIQQLFQDDGWINTTIIKDLNHLPRVVIGFKP